MKRPLHTRTALLAAFLAAAFGTPGFGGGPLETIDITSGTPSPIAGHLLAKVIGIRWDVRSIPVQYSVNNTLDPIPNPIGAPDVTLAAATTAFQESLDTWNRVRTSYIEMNVTGTTANPGLVRFDMVNELTFRTSDAFGAIASSPSTALIADLVFADGDDIDGDGDSDVSAEVHTARDTDGDGDIEFPAGSYEAGTILDNDVQFNTKASNGFRFTVDPALADTVTRAVDLICVAVHEFGHSFGLAHTLNNQKSDVDGTGATMFPFIDTGDPAAELSARTLDSDDKAWASYLYPEGSAWRGPAALRWGDIPFEAVYGLIKGDVRHGVLDQPLAGASVFAVDEHFHHHGCGHPGRAGARQIASGPSGTTQLSFNPATGGLFFLPSPSDGVLDGRYVIPVPTGVYRVGIEALDGQPAAGANISFTAQIGNFYGQQNFNEEFFGWRDDDVERRPGRGLPVPVFAGHTRRGIDIVTNRTVNINNFGNRNFIGFINSPAGQYYAVRIPAAQFTAANPPGGLVHGVLFDTAVVDASVVPVFAEAIFTTGEILPDGTATLDLEHPLARDRTFVGQDSDFAPWFFERPSELGRRIQHRIDSGKISDLFLVLRLPTETPFPGVSGQPPLIGLDGGTPAPNDAPIFGYSYLSPDGVTFTRNDTFNFRFSLVLSEPPAH